MNETALKERVKVVAKEKGITFNECFKQLTLERMLARVARSTYSEKLIFKGGLLLSYLLEIGRETLDLDFLVTRMKTEQEGIRKAFERIASIDLKDGFVFEFRSIELLAQPHMRYPGYRISLDSLLGKMKDVIQIDLGVGDAVDPEPVPIKLFSYRGKPIFEDEISLLAYPLETVFAEKLEALVSRGPANSRMKDYHDLLMLKRLGELKIKKLRTAIGATFENRNTKLQLPLGFTEQETVGIQRLWSAHIRVLGDIASLLKIPDSIEDVFVELNRFLKKLKLENRQ